MKQGILGRALGVTESNTPTLIVLISTAVTFVLMLLAVKLTWGWIIPDLLPGMVAQGLIVPELTWLSAFKVALLAALVSGLGRMLVGPFNR
jgi:hypothetical protein